MSEPLRIRFATETEGARSSIANLAGSIASNMVSAGSAVKAANDNVGTLTSAFGKLPAVIRNAAVAFIAFEAVKLVLDATAEAARRAQERMEDLVKLARSAETAGVGTTFLQRLTNQAKELGTEAGKLEEMLNHARQASTVRIGEGDSQSTSTMLDRLKQNVLASNLKQGDLDRFSGAKSQEDRIRVVLDLVEELQAKGMQLAALDLAGKMFGSDFETKLRTGVDMVAKMREALDGVAKTVGGERIIPPEEVERAKEINEQIQRTRNIIAESLRPLNEDIAKWQLQQLAAYGDMYSKVGDLIQALATVYNWLSYIGGKIEEIGNLSVWNKITEGFKALGMYSESGLELVDVDKIKKAGSAPADGSSGGPLKITVPNDKSNVLPALKVKASSPEKDAVETYIEQLERSTAALKAETEAYGKSNEEKQKSIALAKGEEFAKQRGSALTDDERARLVAVGEAAGRARDQMAELQAASARAAEATRAFGDMAVDALSGMITEGRSFTDVLTSMEKQLAKFALQAALLGSGPLAGLFGTAPAAGGVGVGSVGGLAGGLAGLFTGGTSGGGFPDVTQWHAAGGLISGPGTGTSDSIAARLSNGEFVVRAAAVPGNIDILRAINARGFSEGGLVGRMAASTGQAGGIVVNYAPTLDARGSIMGPGELRAMFDAHTRQMRAELPGLVRNARARGAL